VLKASAMLAVKRLMLQQFCLATNTFLDENNLNTEYLAASGS
jgi:hypothetical protein